MTSLTCTEDALPVAPPRPRRSPQHSHCSLPPPPRPLLPRTAPPPPRPHPRLPNRNASVGKHGRRRGLPMKTLSTPAAASALRKERGSALDSEYRWCWWTCLSWVRVGKSTRREVGSERSSRAHTAKRRVGFRPKRGWWWRRGTENPLRPRALR